MSERETQRRVRNGLARLDTEAGRIGERIDAAIKAGDEDEADRLLGLWAACDAHRMHLHRERTGLGINSCNAVKGSVRVGAQQEETRI